MIFYTMKDTKDMPSCGCETGLATLELSLVGHMQQFVTLRMSSETKIKCCTGF